VGFIDRAAGIPAFTKAVISIWFKVPAATLAATDAAYEGDGVTPFDGITPLVVFGDDSVDRYSISQSVTGSIGYSIQDWKKTDTDDLYGPHDFKNVSTISSGSWNSYEFELDEATPQDPCYIGIDCNQSGLGLWDGETEKTNVLRINLQMPNVGSGTGLGYSTSLDGPTLVTGTSGTNTFLTPDESGTIVAYAYDLPEPGGTANIIAGTGVMETTTTLTDKTDVALEASTERFIIQPDVEVTPDVWHHVLVSIDLGGEITATGRQYDGYDGLFPIPPSEEVGELTTPCRIWLSYDDANINGTTLLGGTFDPETTELPNANALFTQNAATAADLVGDVDHTIGPQLVSGNYISISNATGYELPTYAYTPANIEGPVGIPATGTYDGAVRNLMMAEVQIFTGVTLDTNVEANRRAFITSDGRPAHPSLAADLMEKEPEIYFKLHSDFITGVNRGTEGDFTPTGTITPYNPGP
jgi:hypothetical protein